MKKAKKMSCIWLALSIFSFISALGGTAGLAFLALRGLYIPMAVVIPLTAHGYWGFGFYVRACYRARLYGRLARLTCEAGESDCLNLSSSVGLKPEAVKDALRRAEKKGYM